jgi:hypothetical protein
VLPDKKFKIGMLKLKGQRVQNRGLPSWSCKCYRTIRKLLVLGKSKAHICFKVVKDLHVDYDESSNSWMTSAKFASWAQKRDHELGTKAKKIVLRWITVLLIAISKNFKH